jgi:hypothetical protein
MTIAPLFITSAARHARHWLREIAYDDMARQVSGWIPNKTRIKNPVRDNKPIKLDFGIPKKHRLAWICRTIQQRPY